MQTSRREFLAAGGALLAQWQPSPRYPDPRVRILDPGFAKYRVTLAKVEQLGTGFRWCEGPVWFGDGRYLLWSDIPNDIVCKSDGSIWFTDPPFGILGFYEGHRATPELPTNVYRVDPQSGRLSVVAGDLNHPNGLAFSPDESVLYVVEAGVTPRTIHAFDVAPSGTLSRKRKLIDAGPGTPDGLRVDVDGNLWVGWGMGEDGLDGVAVFDATGKPIGRVDLPERCANLCFGGGIATGSSCAGARRCTRCT